MAGISATVTFPLVGAFDTAMSGRLMIQALLVAALGSLVFNFIYFASCGWSGLLRKRTGGRICRPQNIICTWPSVAMVLGSLVVVAMPAVHLAAQMMLTASDEVEALMTRYRSPVVCGAAALGNAVLLGALFGRQQMRLVLLHITLKSVQSGPEHQLCSGAGDGD